ncbi:MAG: hypothetical protein ACYC8T_03260 [Myxococcaceae bacterium]
MSLAVAAMAVGLIALPAAAEAPLTHFPDVPFARLTLVDTVSARGAAVVEGPDGQAEIVNAGDLLGREAVKVLRIGRGCVSLSSEGSAGPTLLCVDEPSAPRS